MIDYETLYGQRYFRKYGFDSNSLEYTARKTMYSQEFERVQRFVSAGSVLDVGCGTGEFLDYFIPEKWIRYGIEPVQFARDAATARGVDFDIEKIFPQTIDLVIFRGTFQHMDEPLATIKRCIGFLKPGGYLIFLATPNIGSLMYRLFEELPALDPPRNFCLVSDRILKQILSNFGLTVVDVVFPYFNTPYAQPMRDVVLFCARFFGVKRKFAFFRNMMEIYARKP